MQGESAGTAALKGKIRTKEARKRGGVYNPKYRINTATEGGNSGEGARFAGGV